MWPGVLGLGHSSFVRALLSVCPCMPLNQCTLGENLACCRRTSVEVGW